MRRARAVSFGKATAHAGAARVRQAIATAEQRRRRTAHDDKRLATAARIVRLLSRIGEAADAAGVEIAVGASSPRGQIPESAPAEDHHILLRIAAGRTTIKVTAAPEAPSEPTVVHGGRLWDVTVPGFYETARELAAEQSGRRPPALSVETLVQLSTQLDATRFAARFGNTGNTQDEEQITLVGLAEQLLLRCWPVTTPGNRNQTWCIPVASGVPGTATSGDRRPREAREPGGSQRRGNRTLQRRRTGTRRAGQPPDRGREAAGAPALDQQHEPVPDRRTPEPETFTMKQIENLTRPLAVVDSEWTDGGPATARIVSLAVARFEPDGSSQRGYWLVNPETPISAASTEVHGIRDEDVANAPAFRDVAEDIENLLAGADIGGYAVASGAPTASPSSMR